MAQTPFFPTFYAVFSYLTDTRQDASVANFGIYRRCVIDAILSMGDRFRYFPTQVQWVGFRKAYLPVQHAERAEGKSSYNFRRLMRLALDTIISFSDKPMRLMVKFGFVITLLSVLIAIVYLVRFLLGDIVVLGYTSLILSLWAIAGIIISLLGVVGLYIGKRLSNNAKLLGSLLFLSGGVLYSIRQSTNRQKTGN